MCYKRAAVRIVILGSGSSGNAAVVEAGAVGGQGPARVLVDAGLSKRALEERLAAQAGLTLAQIDAVLITHDHSDHLGCAADLGRPLYAPAAARRRRELAATRVLAGQVFTIGALRVTPVDLPHDAEETVGY